jgi:hypothetical protein
LSTFNLKKEQIDALQNQLGNLNNIRNPAKYRVQRRRIGDIQYLSFPLTPNKFLIDEESALDFVSFDEKGVQKDLTETTGSVRDSALARPFGIPAFMQHEQKYEYRVSAVTTGDLSSDYSETTSVIAQASISDPLNFQAAVLNPRFIPAVVQLTWNVDELRAHPDHWRIERRVNIPSDSYHVIGNAYLDSEFFDRTSQPGNQYVYRIRSVSASGVESNVSEITIGV